ncbi:DNA transposition protein [Zavarzinia aquatilis]|uniref:DNA transposition protein n=1 Tax=Zavarzinia aquatilis TaxID=2211142 RepID=A0A317EI53_9PROT|nr:DNA transposition protein [Zavarzinia aquatilis]PWR26004.1 DNA transposition protein [Zavarzinia aquatilis]
MAARGHRDPRQGDLLGWEPPALVERYDERRVRAGSLRGQIARAVAETLTDSELDRDEIARRMSDYLGEDVSRSMLDAYASQAKEDHTISYVRLVALVEVTGDPRPLQLAAELTGRAVIEGRYVHAIRAEMIREKREELDREEKSARRLWKGARR